MCKNKQVSLKSKLFRLRSFIYKTVIVRVDGQLKNAVALDNFEKQPIVLPGDSIKYQIIISMRVQ